MVNSPNLRNRGPLGTVFSNRVRSVRLAGRLTRGFGKAVLLIGLCFVMIYPILFILSSGFKSIEDIYNPSVVWVPQQFSLQAMDVAIRILEYPKALLKTASILVPSVMLQLLTVLLAGYGFARFRFPGRSLFFGVLIFTIIVPVQSYIIPLFVNMKNFDYFGIGSLIGLVTGEPVTSNLIDSPAVFYILALFGMGIRSGLCIFIIRQFFRNMPVELEEAAMIDGASKWQMFMKVTVPLITPVIFFNFIMQTTQAFQEFTGPYVITGGGPTYSTYLFSLYIYDTAFKYFDMGYGAALAWVLFLVVAVFAAIAFKSSKYWVFYSADKGGKNG